MKIALLDVNVLIVLAWPNHVHHELALDWFKEQQQQWGWATCPTTQSGFVRVSSKLVMPAWIAGIQSAGMRVACTSL